MQSWMHSEAGDIRKLTARDFMMVIGSNPPELLDRPSFVEAIKSDLIRLNCLIGQALWKPSSQISAVSAFVWERALYAATAVPRGLHQVPNWSSRLAHANGRAAF